MEGGKCGEVGGACGSGRGESRRAGVEGRRGGSPVGKRNVWLGGRLCWRHRERRLKCSSGLEVCLLGRLKSRKRRVCGGGRGRRAPKAGPV